MTVCILCPCALADPEPGEFDEWPPVAAASIRATLLRRGRFSRHTRAADPQIIDWPHDRWIRAQFGLPDGANPDAYEALAHLNDMAQAQGALVVRPVHLHVGIDHLMLLPPHALSLTQKAAEALADSANRHFEGEIRIEVLTPACWLMRSDTLNTLSTRSASIATGRDVRRFVPQGADARRLATLINELQMLWHEHPVNTQREADEHLVVNGLWVEGSLPSPTAKPFNAVYSDQLALRMIAEQAGVTEVGSTPRAAEELRQLFGRTDMLVELSFWRRPFLDRDAASWRAAWGQFEDLMAGAVRLAPHNTRLRLVFCGERHSVILDWSARDRLKWWRGIDHGPGPSVDE